MGAPSNGPKDREITYQVGWKRGRIQVGDHTKADPVDGPAVDGSKDLIYEWVDRFAWRHVPLPPTVYLQVGLWLLPVAAFGITLWTVYLLARQ